MRVTAITIFLILALAVGSAWAHGDGHDPAPAATAEPETAQEHAGMSHEAHAEEPSTYGMDMESENFSGEGTYGIEPGGEMADHSEHAGGMPSSEPGLFENSMMEIEPASSAKHDAEHAMDSHKQHVEPTSFERVSSDAPGHGIAIGLTILAGLTFGLLTLIRPFEK